MVQRLPLVIGSNNLPTRLDPADELPNVALPTNVTLKGLAGMTPPVGSTADREVSPAAGRYRYNTTLGCHEGFTPDGWVRMSNIIIAAYRGNVVPTSGTTRIPLDNTAPMITEGTQLWSKAVTPTIIGSVMSIDFACMADCSNTGSAVTLSLYRDSVLLAVVSQAVSGLSGNKPINLKISTNDTTTSLTAVTYSIRVGNETSGTWYVGRGSAATMGAVNNAGWAINEVLT